MKKIFFFLPAIVFTIFYGWAALGGIGAIHPIILIWLVLFWIAGVLLCKTMSWGGCLGIFPAACFIYMGTQETGQVISETPIGMVVLLYYAVCTYCVYKRNRTKSSS